MPKGPFGEDLDKVPFFPKERIPDAEGRAGRDEGVVKRIAMLEKHPDKVVGKAWKSFFDRFAGQDLDDLSHATVIPGTFPAFLPWEHVSGPQEWDFIYVLASSGSDVALHGHAINGDSYVASWFAVIAPRLPLEKDDFALKMIAAAAIEGGRRALVAIARKQFGVDISGGPFKPSPQEYHRRIAEKHAADLRGAPIFSEVRWSGDTTVDPNDDFFNAG